MNLWLINAINNYIKIKIKFNANFYIIDLFF